jgi:hypothetical protein
MNKFLNIEDVADDRGEETVKIARMLTRKECKLYLHLGGSENTILCMTEYLNEKGNYSIYQIRRGVEKSSKKQSHCTQREIKS